MIALPSPPETKLLEKKTTDFFPSNIRKWSLESTHPYGMTLREISVLTGIADKIVFDEAMKSLREAGINTDQYWWNGSHEAHLFLPLCLIRIVLEGECFTEKNRMTVEDIFSQWRKNTWF